MADDLMANHSTDYLSPALLDRLAAIAANADVRYQCISCYAPVQPMRPTEGTFCIECDPTAGKLRDRRRADQRAALQARADAKLRHP